MVGVSNRINSTVISTYMYKKFKATRIRGTQKNGGTNAHQPSESFVIHRTTFGAVVVNVNKCSVSADARAFTPNYMYCLGVNLFYSKRLRAKTF